MFALMSLIKHFVPRQLFSKVWNPFNSIFSLKCDHKVSEILNVHTFFCDKGAETIPPKLDAFKDALAFDS